MTAAAFPCLVCFNRWHYFLWSVSVAAEVSRRRERSDSVLSKTLLTALLSGGTDLHMVESLLTSPAPHQMLSVCGMWNQNGKMKGKLGPSFGFTCLHTVSRLGMESSNPAESCMVSPSTMLGYFHTK